MSNSYLPIAYFTSCRELQREGVGVRRRSLLDLLAESPNFSCNGRAIRVTDVIVDDDDSEFAMAWRAARLWTTTQKAMKTKSGWCMEPRLHRVSRKSLHSSQHGVAGGNRPALRDQFETALLRILNKSGCEAGVCDSYMTIFGTGFLGVASPVMINLHPGITTGNHPAQLLGPTPNRDAYTRARFGYIIVDDKARVFWPTGSPQDVEYEGRTRRAISVPKIAETGVTAHHIEKAVDRGQVIAQASYSFNAAAESEDSLRARNHALKLSVLKAALEKVFQKPVPR